MTNRKQQRNLLLGCVMLGLKGQSLNADFSLQTEGFNVLNEVARAARLNGQFWVYVSKCSRHFTLCWMGHFYQWDISSHWLTHSGAFPAVTQCKSHSMRSNMFVVSQIFPCFGQTGHLWITEANMWSILGAHVSFSLIFVEVWQEHLFWSSLNINTPQVSRECHGSNRVSVQL